MNKRVKVIPFLKIKNAFIVISGRKTERINLVTPSMSFFYVNEVKDIAVEWEPRYGPITTIYKCNEKDPDAEPHWYFDYCTGYGNWSQLAVNENNLGKLFYTGEYEALFRVLKDWCN